MRIARSLPSLLGCACLMHGEGEWMRFVLRLSAIVTQDSRWKVSRSVRLPVAGTAVLGPYEDGSCIVLGNKLRPIGAFWNL